jgi:ribulose-bisphosphate carboxylase large chain
MRTQIAFASGPLDTIMVAPMVLAPSTFGGWCENPCSPFCPSRDGGRGAHCTAFPRQTVSFTGADAVIFPNYGGRFGYTPDTCSLIARTSLADYHGMRPCLPVPAGGMTRERVPDMLEFYGADVMLLIGGALLEARERLTENTAAFVNEVGRFRYA